MHRRHQRAKFGKLRGVLAWTLLGAAGCSSHPLTASKDQPYDPLIGPPPPASIQPTAPATQTSSLPPIPHNAGLTTNAALASQTPSAQTLAITNSDGWARKVDSQSPPPSQTPATPTSQPKVQPIPKDTNPISTPIQPTAWSGAQPAAAPTDDQIDKQLTDHGVIGHNKETVPGGVRLTCAVRTAANPNMVQNYYTTAVDYPTAAQAIIHEIEAQKAH